jgi:hypothetical protein
MEFREEVDKVKKERGHKVVSQPPDDNRSGLFSNTAPGGSQGWMNRQKIKIQVISGGLPDTPRSQDKTLQGLALN